MKRKNSLIANLQYAFSNIWKWDKGFYLFFILTIPLAVLLPLMAIYFPKLLIDSIESQQDVKKIICLILLYNRYVASERDGTGGGCSAVSHSLNSMYGRILRLCAKLSAGAWQL